MKYHRSSKACRRPAFNNQLLERLAGVMEEQKRSCNTRRKSCRPAGRRSSNAMTVISATLVGMLLLPSALGECNHVTLVECFIEVLDEFALLLFNAKDNVVTIDSEQCKEVKRMGDCMNDMVPSKKHGCTKEEAVTTSRELSDLLIHRENAGTFISTYYLLKFSCEDAGRDIIAKHAQCLRRERIGKLTYSATGYITRTYLEADAGQVMRRADRPADQKRKCEQMTGRITEYNSALHTLCPERSAGIFMCESIKSVVNGVFSQLVGDCTIDCNKGFPLENEVDANGEESQLDLPADGNAANVQAQGLNGAASSTPSAAAGPLLRAHAAHSAAVLLSLFIPFAILV